MQARVRHCDQTVVLGVKPGMLKRAEQVNVGVGQEQPVIGVRPGKDGDFLVILQLDRISRVRHLAEFQVRPDDGIARRLAGIRNARKIPVQLAWGFVLERYIRRGLENKRSGLQEIRRKGNRRRAGRSRQIRCRHHAAVADRALELRFRQRDKIRDQGGQVRARQPIRNGGLQFCIGCDCHYCSIPYRPCSGYAVDKSADLRGTKTLTPIPRRNPM